MDSSAFRNTARDALLRRLGVRPVQTTTTFTPTTATGGFTPASTGGFTPAAAPDTRAAPDDAGDAPEGKACTSNRDCGRRKTCINGTCQTPNRQDAGRQCLRKADCPPGKKCVNGTCTNETPGGDPTPDPPVDDGTCDPPCAAGQSCTNGTCTTPDPGDDDPPGSGDTCSTTAQCSYGEECVNGKCTTPAGEREQINNLTDQEPERYLGNLARTGTLQAEGGTAFGNFLAQRAFPNIVTAFEEEALTDPNLKFKTWLSRQQRYGMPNLDMVDAEAAGTTPLGAQADVQGQGRNKRRRGGNGTGPECGTDDDCPGGQRCGGNGKCKPVECDNDAACGEGKACLNGVCVKQDEVNEQLTPEYRNVQGFANYLRDLYYGASSRDRGQDNAAYGQGATRWSAW